MRKILVLEETHHFLPAKGMPIHLQQISTAKQEGEDIFLFVGGAMIARQNRSEEVDEGDKRQRRIGQRKC